MLESPMELGQRYALRFPWWVWKDAEIQGALEWVKQHYWLRKVRGLLEENKRAGRLPASMKDLSAWCFLDRVDRTVDRLAKGRYRLTDQKLLAMSASLKIPVRELLPTECEWIGGAARRAPADDRR